MLYIGIDNGLSGGIAVIDDKEDIVAFVAMPVIKGDNKTEYNVNEIIEMFNNLKERDTCLYACLEKAHVQPISGKRACFTTGYCYGLMQGILGTLNISYQITSPQTWQKELLDGLSSDTKLASITFCKRKYPLETFTATDRSTKPHDGITDALCMAVYCKRKHMGGIK